jgi:DNA-binding transcriptional MerR regulator
MRIGELATRTDVSVRALRYYEEQDLLASERSSSGQRHYPDSAVDRVHLIQRLYTAGLPSKTIRDLLPCVVNGEATPELLARLSSERDRIDRQIGDLAGTRDRLDAVIAAATANWRTGDPCR